MIKDNEYNKPGRKNNNEILQFSFVQSTTQKSNNNVAKNKYVCHFKHVTVNFYR